MSVQYKVTNKWTAPNNLVVWTYSIPFPDGVRSVAAVVRSGYTPTETTGWTAISTSSPSSSTQSGAPGGIGTAKTLDACLAKGDVIFDLHAHTGKGLGRAPWSGKQVSQGLWARDPSIATGSGAAKELSAWQWATQRLAALASQSVSATAGPSSSPLVGPSSSPVPSPSNPRGGTIVEPGYSSPAPAQARPIVKVQPMPVRPPPPPPPPNRRPLYYGIGGVVLLGALLLLVLD
jgi:hypothetical protein